MAVCVAHFRAPYIGCATQQPSVHKPLLSPFYPFQLPVDLPSQIHGARASFLSFVAPYILDLFSSSLSFFQQL